MDHPQQVGFGPEADIVNRDGSTIVVGSTCSGHGATSSERGAPVSYRYSFEDLLVLLHGHAPAKVDAVALHRRRVEHGHLSVD